jgi:DNA-binding transcriptional LysR family regulator
MDRFEEMRNFVRVVDAGSITRAADLTHLAKSAVSRRLSDLEGRLGVQLLNRTTRRMTLTDAGQRFYDESNRHTG